METEEPGDRFEGAVEHEPSAHDVFLRSRSLKRLHSTAGNKEALDELSSRALHSVKPSSRPLPRDLHFPEKPGVLVPGRAPVQKFRMCLLQLSGCYSGLACNDLFVLPDLLFARRQLSSQRYLVLVCMHDPGFP